MTVESDERNQSLKSLTTVIYRIVKGWLNLNDNKPMY